MESKANKTLGQFQGQKLIHIDLKGAPPLDSYFKQFFQYISKLGATGVLIEYEDMFFYENELQNIRAKNAYSPKHLKIILNSAKKNNLTVIPMIQVLGHLEFVLKLKEFKGLREVKDNPETLCPTNEKALFLIEKMIDQVLKVHPESSYIHIGCNDVQHLGMCNRCRDLMRQNNWSTAELFLNYLKKIALYIKKNYPRVRPIVWGDTLSKFGKPLIAKSEIYGLVDVMVLVEGAIVSDYFTHRLIYLYASLFRRIWIASAFKGPGGPSQGVIEINSHLENHISWMNFIDKWKGLIKFKGIALIGRQRQNHFSELCELLPLGIPSLTVSLIYLNDTSSIDINGTESIECAQPFLFQSSSSHSSRCPFPGRRIYMLVAEFERLNEKIREHLILTQNGQLSIYNIMHKFINSATVKLIFEMQSVEKNFQELLRLENEIEGSLLDIYDDYTVQEWIETFITPVRIKLEALIQVKEALMLEDTWPRRPFALGNYNLRKAVQNICASYRKLDCALLLI